MRINRLYTSVPLRPETVVRLDPSAGHYLSRVLKLRPGDPLVLFNGDGNDYAAELANARRDAMEVRVTARLPAVPAPGLRITLAQAIGKGDRMDQCLQKATELGVAALQPLFTERTAVRLDGERLARRVEHWRRVTISACEQCGRAELPDLAAPLTLDEWLAGLQPGETAFALTPGAGSSLAEVSLAGSVVSLLVGPEGGFSDNELMQLQRAGLSPVALGPRVLRTETAGPAAIAVLQALYGDFR
jgi:16S rRNA (uracil1498-N3)-methyltransferase